jgi:hypothetical protein
MAFVITDLTGWVNENSQTLMTQGLIGNQTGQLVTIMPGIKDQESIKYLDTELVVAAGGCGYSPSGNTTLGKKTISVVSLRTQETLCPEDLNTTSLQLSMKPGFNQSIPFEQQWADLKVKKLQRAIEDMVWSTTNASSVKCAGWLYLAANDTTVLDYTFGVCNTGQTASDYINALFGAFNKLAPEAKSKTDLTLFVGYGTASLMIQALILGNLYHIDATDKSAGIQPFMFPGIPIKVVPIRALDTKCEWVLTPASNLIIGVDLLNENDQIDLWWSTDSKEVRSSMQWKIGTNYYWGDEIVLITP